MSNSPMVPIFAPDGTLGDVPYERLQEALNNGGKIAIRMQAPNSKDIGYVPADRAQEAVKNGGKPVGPEPQAEKQNPGFWKSYGEGLKNFVGGVLESEPTNLAKAGMAANQIAMDAATRSSEDRSPAYNVSATAANVVGIPTRGMEEAANVGDTAGVLGHAAAAATPVVAGEAVHAGAPLAGEQLSGLRSFLREKLFTADGKMTPLGKSLAHPIESAAEYGLRRAVGAEDVEQKGASVPITKSPNFNAAEYKAGKAGRFETETEAGTTFQPGGKIVEPGSKPPDTKVTYQSVPGVHLLEKVMGGDLDAIAEWQRRGLPLPENVKFLVEKGGTKPWRNLEK